MDRVFAGLSLLLLPTIADAQPARRPNPAKFGWHTSYESARAAARKTGKPILLVFRCEA